jgi:hypothetical protein
MRELDKADRKLGRGKNTIGPPAGQSGVRRLATLAYLPSRIAL